MLRLAAEEQRKRQDPDVLFCLSLVPRFKNFNEDMKELAQIEVLQTLRRLRCGAAKAQTQQPSIIDL